jgi:hypothetical protein
MYILDDSVSVEGGARLLIQSVLARRFVTVPGDVTEVMEDQAILVTAIEETVNALRKRKKGCLDPRQVARAAFIAAWRDYQNLSDGEFDAAQAGPEDGWDEIIDALRGFCEPHDGLNNDDEAYLRGR